MKIAKVAKKSARLLLVLLIKERREALKVSGFSEMKDVEKFYTENKDWVDELAAHGSPVIRAIALVIVKNGTSPRESH